MRESIHVLGAMGLVLSVGLACKGKSDNGTTTTASATASTMSAPVANKCTESTKEGHGSLHAEVAWGAPFDPPKSKKKVLFDCGSKQATALFLEYATAAQASSMCDFTGPQLWGGNAPTSRDPDELLTKDGSLVIVSGDAIDDLTAKMEADGYAKWRPGKTAPVGSGSGSGSGSGPAPSLDPADFKAALDCTPASKDPLRAWCPVASFATSGYSQPPSPATYVGITIPVKPGVPLKTALLGNATVSALTIGSGKIKVNSITPDNENEKKALASTVLNVAKVLKGESASKISVGADLSKFLDTLKSDLATKGFAIAPSTGKPSSYTGTNPSDVALVWGKPDAYVVLEHAKDGTWVNVFPARAYGP